MTRRSSIMWRMMLKNDQMLHFLLVHMLWVFCSLWCVNRTLFSPDNDSRSCFDFWLFFVSVTDCVLMSLHIAVESSPVEAELCCVVDSSTLCCACSIYLLRYSLVTARPFSWFISVETEQAKWISSECVAYSSYWPKERQILLNQPGQFVCVMSFF
jgi:hypothetical protein